MKRNLSSPIRQLAAAEPAPALLPKDSKDMEGFRKFFTSVRAQACSVSETYTGPLKQLWDDLVAKFDAALAALPKNSDGTWSLTDNLDCFFSCLASANAVASQLSLELSKARQAASAADATSVTAEIDKRITAGEFIRNGDIAARVAAAIDGKIAAGDLVPKDYVSQLCSASKDNGIKEGELKARGEIEAEKQRLTLISTRRNELQTASIALPDAEFEGILGAKDEEFAAAKALFNERKTALEKIGIQLSSELFPNLWLPGDKYGTFEKTVKSIPALQLKPNPLLAEKDTQNDTPMMVV